MTALEDEIRADVEEDARAIVYVQEHLPDSLKKVYDLQLIQGFIDIFVDILAESDALDADPDADGCINLNLDEIAVKATEESRQNALGFYPVEDVRLILDKWLDFEEEYFHDANDA